MKLGFLLSALSRFFLDYWDIDDLAERRRHGRRVLPAPVVVARRADRETFERGAGRQGQPRD